MLIETLSFQKHKRLSVVQFATNNKNTFDYISCDKAIKQNFIEVKEVSQQGSVNDLLLINNSNQYVFFMDGDILQGAKQNRVLNTSVLAAPNTKIKLPVSCVEQGRWRTVSAKFNPSDYVSPQKLRAKKSEAVKMNLMSSASYYASQGEVWDEVSSYLRMNFVNSRTSNLSDIYENKKQDFEKFIELFKPAEDANGIAIFVDQQLLNTDVFNRTDIYNEYFPKILRSTAMEVFYLQDKENNLTEAEAFYKTTDLFDNLPQIKFTTHPGVGVGEEKRFDTKALTGLELSFQNHLIHLTLLNLEYNSSENKNAKRWSRF
ncbi:MAG: hypothetical protein N2043_06590 [Ignavibacterium sp.]|nr:hypothetical protein [Ignavibacterium sp.]